jgi:hypothetical protein
VGGLASLAFLVLVIVVAAALIRSRPGSGLPASSGAIQTLEKRYANGEISRDEFLERRAVLTAPRRSLTAGQTREQLPDLRVWRLPSLSCGGFSGGTP